MRIPPASHDHGVVTRTAEDDGSQSWLLTVRAVYRASNATLHEIGWTPGGVDTRWHLNLSSLARNVPDCADSPAAIAVDGPNSQHVAYRAKNSHIYELRRW